MDKAVKKLKAELAQSQGELKACRRALANADSYLDEYFAHNEKKRKQYKQARAGALNVEEFGKENK